MAKPPKEEPLELARAPAPPWQQEEARARQNVSREAAGLKRDVSPQRPPPDASERLARAWARHPIAAFFSHRGRIAFYRQFHALVKAGSGMPVALADLSRYAANRRLSAALAAVARDLEEGSGLGAAMAKHEGLFDDATVELLVFAEETGSLEKVLAKIVAHLEAMQKLRWMALFGALWPAYLAVAFVFVGPLFGVAGAVEGGSSWGVAYCVGLLQNLLIAAASIAVVFCFPFAIALAGAETGWDSFKLSLPVVGGATRRIYASRFLLALGTAVSAGLEVSRAIRVSTKAAASPALLGRLRAVEARLRRGGSLTDAVETLGLLDRPSLGTLAVAERTGTLDDALEGLATETQESAIRAIRILIIVVLALFAAAMLAMIVVKLLATLFGPVKSYYDLPNKLE